MVEPGGGPQRPASRGNSLTRSGAGVKALSLSLSSMPSERQTDGVCGLPRPLKMDDSDGEKRRRLQALHHSQLSPRVKSQLLDFSCLSLALFIFLLEWRRAAPVNSSYSILVPHLPNTSGRMYAFGLHPPHIFMNRKPEAEREKNS